MFDKNDEPIYLYGTIQDITEKREMEKLLSYNSTHDEITGLPNRVYFKKQLEYRFQISRDTQTKFSLMMLDVDGLKYINYALDYEIGHKIIVKIVNRLRNFLGENVFISRYSDDHFAIIIDEQKTNEELDDIAKGIISLFKSPYMVQAYEVDIFVNIGISIYSKDVEDADSFRKQAKTALLRAKRDGKNTYSFYSSDLDIQNYKEFTLKNDLHHAIENEQLKVYYQPIVNIKTNQILAAEALIRWQHPDWGIVSPKEFIFIAEETGLIIEIGKWVLSEVCKSYKQWLDYGFSAIKVSINYSVIQFFENDFVENIKNIINKFQLEPNFLIIEITESVLLRDIRKVISDIKKLQSYGIKVAIDDFGTGFSSLSYLHSFNIDILKIDGSFIKNAISNKTSDAITRAIVNMAHDIKVKLVAEGIENFEQLSYLKQLNCHTGQGYI